jgi:hypothetical protein
MDSDIDKDNRVETSILCFGIPALYKRRSSLPNKSTFRDFYPYELRPNDNNLNELRRGIKDFLEKKGDGGPYNLRYSGVDYQASLASIVNVIAFLTEDSEPDNPKEIERGPRPLLLDPIIQATEKYNPAIEGEGYYLRNSVLIPTNYLIEKFLTVEGRYIAEFDFHFGFPVSFLIGLFSYNPSVPYPKNKQRIPIDESLRRAAEFFLYTPFSLKNYSGVSAFMESTARMILMDILDASCNQYEKAGIEKFYWNTKTSGLRDGEDAEKGSSMFLNMALDILYMAIHTNYYAKAGTQSNYIENIRNKFPDDYNAEEGDIKFMDPHYGFHPETVASYVLYPFISMIYSGFLSGFSPSVMVNYGQTVFRTFVAKQLRWFRYAWHSDCGGSSIGFYWQNHRDENVWARHNLIYFARRKAFEVTGKDIDFMRKVMVYPLETFVKDYDNGEGVRIYAGGKDRKAAGTFLEYVKTATDWADHRISDEELAKKYPDVVFDSNRAESILWKDSTEENGTGMVSWLQSFLSPYVEMHQETEYSPFPHLFSNRGLFKHHVDPYVYVGARDTGDFSKWKELEFYSKVFEKNPVLKDMNTELDLLSPPLTQAVNELRFNVLLDETSVVGVMARDLSEYYLAGFNPRLPFRGLPLMMAIPREKFDFYAPTGADIADVERLDIPFKYVNGGSHLIDFLDVSSKISDVLRNISDPQATVEAMQKKVEEIGNGLDFHPFEYNYYYHIASNTGNFFYNGNPVTDLNTGDRAPLFIEKMNKMMFDKDYGVGDDREYMKNLPSSWLVGDALGNPYFDSDKIFENLAEWKLFKDGFTALLTGDVLLLSLDNYKDKWSNEHRGQSPNAYQYLEGI